MTQLGDTARESSDRSKPATSIDGREAEAEAAAAEAEAEAEGATEAEGAEAEAATVPNGADERARNGDRTEDVRLSETDSVAGNGQSSSTGHADGYRRAAGDATATEAVTRTVRSTGRWRGVVGVALLAVAVGVLVKRPSLLLVAAIGVAFAAYPRFAAAPDPDLSISRRVEPESPADGETVTVHTTVRNEGDGTLFDLRIVDGTPPMLPVDGGSPRHATALRPGGEATLSYELRVRPGRHLFQPTTLLCRDASGSVEVEIAVTAADTIECSSRVPTVPLRARSRHRTGPLVTDEGGSGLEFHSVEEYERGDPASRIDWRRFARTGDLTTVAFRTERLADVVVCVDARPEAYRASDPTEPHAVAHAVDAAGRIGDALFDLNHRVGLAAFGRDVRLLPPGSGRDHADRFRHRLVSDPTLSLAPPRSARTSETPSGTVAVDRAEPDSIEDLDRQLSRIRARLGSNTQVILLTPLCDDEAPRIAQRFESGGAAVTVVSPDVTTDRTAGGRLARLERDRRLTTLRNAGVPAVDWDPGTSLGAALAAVERWER